MLRALRRCRRAPSWVTAAFLDIRCPQKSGGTLCGATVLSNLQAPRSWQVYARPTVTADSARGFVTQCPDCHGLVEIVVHQAARSA